MNVVPFEDDKRPPKAQQFGLAMRFKPKGIDTEFALYYERYHDKLPFTTLFTDPSFAAFNVANIGYYNEYGKKKNLFGASFNTKAGPVAVGGELSYRPRDSVAIDGSVPLPGPYSIFEPANADAERPHHDARLRRGEEVPGAPDRPLLHRGELADGRAGQGAGRGRRHGAGRGGGHALPEPADSATVPYLIFPSYESPTKTSWGYALEFDLSYPRVWGSDWNLTQSTVFTHDVGGISPNTLPFVKGRKSLFVGLLLRQQLGVEGAVRLHGVLRRRAVEHHPRPRQHRGQPVLQLLTPRCSLASCSLASG